MPVRALSAQHEALGHAIRQLRERTGVSQKELAARTGLHPTYISGVERGVRNPTWQVIVTIAKALDVKPSQIAQAAERLDREL